MVVETFFCDDQKTRKTDKQLHYIMLHRLLTL